MFPLKNDKTEAEPVLFGKWPSHGLAASPTLSHNAGAHQLFRPCAKRPAQCSAEKKFKKIFFILKLNLCSDEHLLKTFLQFFATSKKNLF